MIVSLAIRHWVTGYTQLQSGSCLPRNARAENWTNLFTRANVNSALFTSVWLNNHAFYNVPGTWLYGYIWRKLYVNIRYLVLLLNTAHPHELVYINSSLHELIYNSGIRFFSNMMSAEHWEPDKQGSPLTYVMAGRYDHNNLTTWTRRYPFLHNICFYCMFPILTHIFFFFLSL